MYVYKSILYYYFSSFRGDLLMSEGSKKKRNVENYFETLNSFDPTIDLTFDHNINIKLIKF